MPTPTITIDGKVCEFTPGQTILQIANANGIEIPQYCYHDGLSIVASCRICLAEVWAPNPRNDNKLEPIPKLLPTCQTTAGDGQVVYTNSPKSVANQKAVMEYLLINHPLDCPVCDQAGECLLQDYSYEYGRGVSRFEETKVKQPKKDLGPNVYIYSDRCIMCTRCVRFTREVAGTAELSINGRGNRSEIDVFPGVPLDNELSANVIDLCPVGALLDKDFLFTQRVWFLKGTPSIDGITASGDNITFEHNEGKIYRVKPRTNMAINKWWITDEVRYGWKHIQDGRLKSPYRRRFGALDECTFAQAYDAAIEGLIEASSKGGKLLLVVSPMLSCEDAYLLAKLARTVDANAEFAVGMVPYRGEDKAFPKGARPGDANAFVMYAEKAPNARGVRRVLESFGGTVHDFDAASRALANGSYASCILTGNYPGEWATDEFASSLGSAFTVLIDTHPRKAADKADVVIPGASWAEKAGTFENANNIIQAFEQAIPVAENAKAEGQIALDLISMLDGEGLGPVRREVVRVDEAPGQVPTAVERRTQSARLYNAAMTRQEMAQSSESLGVFVSEVRTPVVSVKQEPDVEMVEL